MRRLFRYGFDRVAIRKGCQEFPCGAIIFENQFFREGRPDLLKLIKIDNKRLYRKAIQKDEAATTAPCVCPEASIQSVLKAPPSPMVSPNENCAKLELLLRMEQARRESQHQSIQMTLEKQCLKKALLLGRLRAMADATAMAHSLNLPLHSPPMNLALTTQTSNKTLSNELLIRSLLSGGRHF